jgi:hypothetical protein
MRFCITPSERERRNVQGRAKRSAYRKARSLGCTKRNARLFAMLAGDRALREHDKTPVTHVTSHRHTYFAREMGDRGEM